MIKNLVLKFGRAPGIAADAIQVTPITVFVGPNNSGKSRVLQELHRFFSTGQRNMTDLVLDRVEFDQLTQDQAEAEISRLTLTPNANEIIQPGDVLIGKKAHRIRLNRGVLLAALQNGNVNPVQFCQWYLVYNTLILNGLNRINLVIDQAGGDLQQQPQISFQVLFRDDARRAEVRRIIHDAFGLFFTIDPTNLGTLRVRLASRAPASNLEERGIHEEAVKFHAGALPIDQSSDGVKAFTGMITEIIAGDPAALLIDEPEAFLHPALATTLGKEVAVASLRSDKRLFVSTHSPNFVMGCIQSGAPVNIIRLTYRHNVATARLLPNAEILRLMRNPLLRSTGVLAGLFYEFVIVTESDTDRAFYQEINERLLRYRPEFGIPNCLFLNAQNKQTVRTIIGPLRQLGIPAVGIVDIDVLKEGGSVWIDFLSSGFIPDLEQQPLGQLRAAVKQKFEETGKNMKLEGGIDLLGAGEHEAADNLFDRLAQYGLFVVRRGELESWLKHLGAVGHGPNWLIDVFGKMGEDPESPTYIRPTNGDVWEFVAAIKKWLTDSGRKGIPT
jgi:ABC-type cobalamin/Fe3+-siderophores transport system ATPase subunit